MNIRRTRKVLEVVEELIIEDLDVEDLEQRDDDFARRLKLVVVPEDEEHWR